ncbi:MAG: helix-turn-helix domain-containing protein [Acidobacteria bacterium]|nr:helix-turn-helix domain-containing protein [Acidobacteriota bacterium]
MSSVKIVLKMVKIGHRSPSITRVNFAAKKQALGFEAVTLATAVQRAGKEHFARPRCAAFFQLMLVNEGTAHQEIDFISYRLKTGSLIFIRPGQVQRLFISDRCKAQLLIFELNFISPSKEGIQPHRISTMIESTPPIRAAFATLFEEYSGGDAHPTSRRILSNELIVLLLRLERQSDLLSDVSAQTSNVFDIFNRFETLLEASFAETRSVAAFAHKRGCSEKTLNRACSVVTGAAPKELIQKRVALEAKRVLVYTNMTVKEISEELGFSEPTNFVKFFRRLTGMLPMAFRDQALSIPVRHGVVKSDH